MLDDGHGLYTRAAEGVGAMLIPFLFVDSGGIVRARMAAGELTPLQEIMADFGKDVLEQLAVQEPVQRVIHDASEGQGGFAENMRNGLRNLPSKAYDVLTGR